MLPKSPWEHSFAFIENDAQPTEDIVLLTFEAIKKLLPTPQTITLDLQFTIALTASSKVLLIDFFNFFNAKIFFI